MCCVLGTKSEGGKTGENPCLLWAYFLGMIKDNNKSKDTKNQQTHRNISGYVSVRVSDGSDHYEQQSQVRETENNQPEGGAVCNEAYGGSVQFRRKWSQKDGRTRSLPFKSIQFPIAATTQTSWLQPFQMFHLPVFEDNSQTWVSLGRNRSVNEAGLFPGGLGEKPSPHHFAKAASFPSSWTLLHLQSQLLGVRSFSPDIPLSILPGPHLHFSDLSPAGELLGLELNPLGWLKVPSPWRPILLITSAGSFSPSEVAHRLQA